MIIDQPKEMTVSPEPGVCRGKIYLLSINYWSCWSRSTVCSLRHTRERGQLEESRRTHRWICCLRNPSFQQRSLEQASKISALSTASQSAPSPSSRTKCCQTPAFGHCHSTWRYIPGKIFLRLLTSRELDSHTNQPGFSTISSHTLMGLGWSCSRSSERTSAAPDQPWDYRWSTGSCIDLLMRYKERWLQRVGLIWKGPNQRIFKTWRESGSWLSYRQRRRCGQLSVSCLELLFFLISFQSYLDFLALDRFLMALWYWSRWKEKLARRKNSKLDL